MAIHAGEIHYDTYGVVGVAVNYAHRLINAPAVRDALATSSGTLVLVTSDWFFTEVVRHSQDSDPTTYRRIRVAEKETDTVAWLHLPDDRAANLSHAASTQFQPSTPITEKLTPTDLWSASDRSVRRLGARRTAYPLDLSIAELHSRGLYVPVTFSALASHASTLDVERLAADVESGSSVLILGEPGSGKSVAAYALLARLRQRVPAIAARASKLRAALESSVPATELTRALRGRWPGDGVRPVLVIDGLDETLGEFESSADVSDLLTQLSERFSIVVTCRRREFEDNLAASVDSDGFDAIYSIATWTLRGQFTEFVQRLVTAGLLDSDRLLAVIARSPALTQMVARPLYARMLTFLGQEQVSAVSNVTSLYAEYIDKLGVASDAALSGAGCRMRERSVEIWIAAAWHIYCKGLLTEDRFDFTQVTAHLEHRFEERTQCLSRALSQICDQWRSGGRIHGRFVHYSFLEYLVSRYYGQRLQDAPTNVEALTECLSVDPSPEIRHFLVAELRETRTSGLANALTDAYLSLRASESRTARVRTLGNLIAYLLSRATDEGLPSLRRLLEDEDDIFLQQAILWGLCHLGDREALVRFVRESRASAHWRAWNRGYVMYYYGDIDRRAQPPYVDEDEQRSWGRTRERSIALMSEPGYQTSVAAQRRYLDLYLLYDYAIWRGETLPADDARVADTTLTALWQESTIDGSLLHELQAMHAVTCPD
jgi:hypothetical protein